MSVLTSNDCQLLNLRKLACRLSVSYDFVKDMRMMGFEMPFGGLTTLTHALDWLNSNPNFREDARILKLSKRRGRGERHQRRVADKCDELPLRRDGLSSSLYSQERQHGLAA